MHGRVRGRSHREGLQRHPWVRGRVSVIYRILALSPPAWPRNSRVGANSPSLWPTIDSETKTGTCLRPSWTAMVWPTISGKIVDARDQVLIICLSPEVFIASMRRSRRSSAHGPFLDERDIRWSFPRRRTRGESKIEVDKDAGRSPCRKPWASPRTRAHRRFADSSGGAVVWEGPSAPTFCPFRGGGGAR